MNLKKQSIFVKFLGFFMAIWIPFSLLTIGFLLNSSNRLAESTLKNSEETLYFFSGLLNNELDKVIRLLYTVSGDMDVLQYASEVKKPYDYSQYLLHRSAQQKLRSYAQTSVYLSDLYLILPGGAELSANYSTSSLEEDDREQLKILPVNSDCYYTRQNMLICLYKDWNGILIGAKVSLRDILDTLRASMGKSSYGCLMIDPKERGLIGKELTEPTGQAIFEAVASMETVPETVSVHGVSYLLREVSAQNNYFSILSYIPRKALYQSADSLRVTFILLNICSIMIPGFMAFIFKRHIHRPLSEIVAAMGKLEGGDYGLSLPEDASSEFGYVFRAFNKLSAQLKTLIEEVWEKKLQVQQAQYAQLQAHINPHFLFNSLYIGYRMAKSGDADRMPEVAKLCMYLGDYFRYITYLCNDTAQLSKEADFIETFLHINQMRFADRMRFSISLEEGTEKLWIPTLMLQPLVENAVKHGVEKGMRPCSIRLEARREGGLLRIFVEDNGGRATPELMEGIRARISSPAPPANGYGLWNVQRRLCSGGLSKGLFFELPEPGRFRVSFSIPAAEEPRDETTERSVEQFF